MTPKTSKLALCGFAIIGIALLANVLRLTIHPSHTVRAFAATPIPYTSVLKETVTDKAGHVGGYYFHTFAVRTDGSSLFKSSGPIGQANENVLRIIELASKVHIDVRDLWERKSTRTSPIAPSQRDPTVSCMNPANTQESLSGSETIASYKAAKITRGNRTSWYAIDYGCALIKERFEWSDGGITEKTLLSLMAGEPEKTLFYVPDSYQEVPPSMIATASGGGAMPMAHDATTNERQAGVLKKLDRYYQDHRPEGSH